MTMRRVNGRPVKKHLNRKRLEDLLEWYEGRTRTTSGGGTTYELTIEALKLLRRADSPSGHPRFEKPDLDGPKDEPIKLSERQAQTLALIKTQRMMVDPKSAANKKIIDALITLGALSEWREVTDRGEKALQLCGFGADRYCK